MDAIDIDEAGRPGVPMEREPPSPLPGAHLRHGAQRQGKRKILTHAHRKEPTPVFSTAFPPRRLSGLVRRLAYAIPEHQAKHWVLLFAGDRLDRLEHLVGRALKLPLYAGAVLAGVALARRRMARAC